MPTAQRNTILDSVVTALQSISGAPNYFYTVHSESVSRTLKPIDHVTIFPALFVAEGPELRKWETFGAQLLTAILDVVIWGYSRADGSIAIDAAHAKEALIHDVDVALSTALISNQFNGTVIDIAPRGTTIRIETDEGVASLLDSRDVGVFRARVPVLYRQIWGQP
jgi:hypothetical protein